LKASQSYDFTLIVPTLNAGPRWQEWLDAYRQQTVHPQNVIIIDSSSTDGTPELARGAGFVVHTISRSDFNHGGTRQMGVELAAPSEFVIFLTQDAILASPSSLECLVASFQNPDVVAAYGRQLPHKDATPVEAFARIFNYPAQSQIKTLKDTSSLGIKTAFISNSFAAYRRSTLLQIGGFPDHTILCEDVFVSARMLLLKQKIAYCADALVHHSHAYGSFEEFRRYFDIGVFHASEPWLMQNFGVRGEGLRFVFSEMKYLLEVSPGSIPGACFRDFLKFIGYHLGLSEKHIPTVIKHQLSMHPSFWQKNTSTGHRRRPVDRK